MAGCSLAFPTVCPHPKENTDFITQGDSAEICDSCLSFNW